MRWRPYLTKSLKSFNYAEMFGSKFARQFPSKHKDVGGIHSSFASCLEHLLKNKPNRLATLQRTRIQNLTSFKKTLTTTCSLVQTIYRYLVAPASSGGDWWLVLCWSGGVLGPPHDDLSYVRGVAFDVVAAFETTLMRSVSTNGPLASSAADVPWCHANELVLCHKRLQSQILY